MVCPECGVPLDGIDLRAHSLTHWPEYLDPARSSKKARVRQERLSMGGVTAEYFVNEDKEG